MNELTNEHRRTDTHFFFWNTIYSQWHTSTKQFQEDGIWYPNAEKYMMIKKAEVFKDEKIKQLMLKTDSASRVKQLGRKIKNFSDEIWNEHKMDIVTQANILKFGQNPIFYNFMTEHKDLILVEASPQDKIWGIGLHFDNDLVLDETKWKGQNLLGQCLMRARKKLL